MKKILFITGTRADYGKMVSLIKSVDKHIEFESYVYITGMHMLKKYGFTADEIIEEKHQNIYLNINQYIGERQEMILSNTIRNLSQYIHEILPDLVIIHGDRVEALAGAITGILSNVLVAHIEGGESSGSVDESIRYSISKLSHIHLVSNEKSAKKLEQMGEKIENIYVTGSPDFDAIFSKNLPEIKEVKKKYDIPFDEYGIFIFHSVTTELSKFEKYCFEVVSGLVKSNKKFILIYPNNDPGSEIIIRNLNNLMDKTKINDSYRIFGSVTFIDFLVMLKNSKCIVGNSSAGVRQAPVFGIPTVNIGTRQNNRNSWESIHNVGYDSEEIKNKIDEMWQRTSLYPICLTFGDGKASERFIQAIEQERFWETSIQK
ncbi:MAG: UDP-N-acetylglucosamine 2-epimerase [Candidatus Gracilibacteria bacterium]|nr:UDP-N-acetylglucosamine 2-epimerase [Candidatus Gracilibacteria bacterium]